MIDLTGPDWTGFGACERQFGLPESDSWIGVLFRIRMRVGDLGDLGPVACERPFGLLERGTPRLITAPVNKGAILSVHALNLLFLLIMMMTAMTMMLTMMTTVMTMMMTMMIIGKDWREMTS